MTSNSQGRNNWRRYGLVAALVLFLLLVGVFGSRIGDPGETLPPTQSIPTATTFIASITPTDPSIQATVDAAVQTATAAPTAVPAPEEELASGEISMQMLLGEFIRVTPPEGWFVDPDTPTKLTNGIAEITFQTFPIVNDFQTVVANLSEGGTNAEIIEYQGRLVGLWERPPNFSHSLNAAFVLDIETVVVGHLLADINTLAADRAAFLQTITSVNRFG